MNWIHEYASVTSVGQILSWMRDFAFLIIIFLMFLCTWYLRQTSRELALIGKIMRDVKWISSKETRRD